MVRVFFAGLCFFLAFALFVFFSCGGEDIICPEPEIVRVPENFEPTTLTGRLWWSGRHLEYITVIDDERYL